MVFSTIIFLFRFLPITLALTILPPQTETPRRFCAVWCSTAGARYALPATVALILINYLSGLAIERSRMQSPRCAAFFCWWRSLAA